MNCLRLFRRWLVNAVRTVQFEAYRDRMERADVFIHSGGRVFGAAGIRIGSGTRIGECAIIAATNLGFGDCFTTEPKGSITLGERCRVHRGAIVVTHGGYVQIGSDVSWQPVWAVRREDTSKNIIDTSK